jgi:hypothetical protein
LFVSLYLHISLFLSLSLLPIASSNDTPQQLARSPYSTKFLPVVKLQETKGDRCRAMSDN